jgi:hypothetical protein
MPSSPRRQSYLDKIHAVYRSWDGTTLLDKDAAPVAMTTAGLTSRRMNQYMGTI